MTYTTKGGAYPTNAQRRDKMLHKVEGQAYHGPYYVGVRLPREGGVLSTRQRERVWRALCSIASCTCGGTPVQPDRSTARIVWNPEAYTLGGDPVWQLLPAGTDVPQDVIIIA